MSSKYILLIYHRLFRNFLFVAKVYNARLVSELLFGLSVFVFWWKLYIVIGGKKEDFRFFFPHRELRFLSRQRNNIKISVQGITRTSTPVVKKYCERDCTRAFLETILQAPSVFIIFGAFVLCRVHHHLSWDGGRHFPEKIILHFPSLPLSCLGDMDPVSRNEC